MRPLRAGVRPVDSAADALVSPVDGKIYAVGQIVDGQIPQSEGKTYPVTELLPGGTAYEGGTYAVIYAAIPWSR